MERNKKGQFIKGYKPTKEEIKARSGWHHTKEARGNISKNNAKYWATHEKSFKHRERIGRAQVGRKHSEETRRKMSEAHLGDKAPGWKGGVTPRNRLIRGTIELRLWREAVFARDNWTCQECGRRGDRLNAHHIKPFAEYPELRTSIDNGVTLCRVCHIELHKLNIK